MEIYYLALAYTLAFFFLFWLISLVVGKSSVIDIGWGFYFFYISVFYFYNSDRELNLLSILIFFSIGLWSIRLGLYLLVRYLREKEEDKRYVKLKKKWKATNLSFVRMFIFQGIIAFIVSYPLSIIMRSKIVNENLIIISSYLIILFTIFESIADYQLFSFKQDRENQNKVCNKGLWSYTRHPNYFFEWMIWVSIGILSTAFDQHLYLGLISPILMYIFLNYVSGIPFLEEDARKGIFKKEGEREYYENTPPFFPNVLKVIKIS